MLKDEPMVGHDVWIADDDVVIGNGAIIPGQSYVRTWHEFLKRTEAYREKNGSAL